MSIEKTASKTFPWRARWIEEGRHRSRSFQTRAEAVKWDAAMKTKDRSHAFAEVDPSSETLREWTLRWIDVHSVSWARSTQRQRANVISAHIMPFLGEVKLRNLGRPRVERWRSELRKNGRSPNMANAAMRVLSACLGAAVHDGLIPFNPCSRIKPLDTVPPDRDTIPLTVAEQIRDLMPTGRDKLIVSLLVYAGLRPGEICALRPRDVLASGHLWVFQTLGEQKELRIVKGRRSRRVPIAPEVARDLEHAGREWLVEGTRGGQLDWHNWREDVWTPVREKLGVKFVPYEGRHTYASQLLEDGASVVKVAARMGHANPSTTLSHYAHLVEDE